MSFIKKPKTNGCVCHSHGGETGSMSLQVHPKAPSIGEVSSEALSLSKRVENEYMGTLQGMHTNEYLRSHHAHPVKLRNGTHTQLPQLATDGNLSFKIMHSAGDDTTVCAEVTPQALADVLRDGTVAVEAPMNNGLFRLHSHTPGVITGMEYLPDG